MDSEDKAGLAARIDAAYLKLNRQMDVGGLRRAVSSVQELGLRGLCVPPVLAGTVKKNYPALRVAAVVSYPLGLDSLAAKLFAIQELAEQRVDEVDVVLDLFALINSNWRKLELEAGRLGDHCRASDVYCKVIIETPLLTDQQLRSACAVLRDSPVDCVKTGTGYGEPVTTTVVELLRQCLGPGKVLKASGGISTLAQAQALVTAGADILGLGDPAGVLRPGTAGP